MVRGGAIITRVKMIKLYKMFIIIFGLCWLITFYEKASASEFGGYECKLDCSGHKAGYEWAEANDITNEKDCLQILRIHRNRRSFYEGCLVYVDDPDRGSDEDDDGNYID